MAIIFKERQKERAEIRITLLSLELIDPNPCQPRKHFDETELAGLSQSIKENGILQPVTVRRKENGRYELIAGERRLRAAKLAGLTNIPSVIAEKTEEESAVLSILENIQRCDLNYFEEAQAISKLIEHYGITQDEVAKRLGKAQSTIANKLRILKLATQLRRQVTEWGFTERQARALLKLPEDKREEAARRIHENGYNTEQADRYIEGILHGGKKPKAKQIFFKEKRLYINNINRTLETMKKCGLVFDSQKRIENGYLEYIIRIPQDER